MLRGYRHRPPPGGFTAEQATAIRNAIWGQAERQAGRRAADPAGWAAAPVRNWQGLSRDPVFRPLVDNEAVSDVGPRGGGAMLLPGTRRLVDRYRESLPAPVGAGRENWLAFMRHHPWLARLLDGADLPDHGRPLVGAADQIDGVPVQVVELTGSPGDVVITHLHVFHARSSDTGPVPRLMVGKEVRRAAG